MQLCPCVSETDDRYPLTTPDHLSDKQYLPDAIISLLNPKMGVLCPILIHPAVCSNCVRPTLRQKQIATQTLCTRPFVNYKVFVSPLLLPYFYPTFTLLRTSL